MRPYLRLTYLLVIACLLVVGASVPIAQEGNSAFATNTPPAPPSAPLIVTNTPIAPVQPPAITTPTPSISPERPLEFYALRMWFERDLIAMIQDQLLALADDGADGELALRISQYELKARVPNAPTNPAMLQETIRIMRDAPRGAVDMRPLVRPYILDEMNRRGGLLSFEYDGFDVRVQPARFDTDALTDALVTIRYPANAVEDAQLLLKDVMLVRQEVGGRFAQIPQTFDLPPLPFDDITTYEIVALADVNRDGLDNVVINVGRANQISEQLYIVGVRNQQAVDLVQAGQIIQHGGILSWNYEDASITTPDLRVRELRPISTAPDWVCNESLTTTWRYDNNFYRRQAGNLNVSFAPEDTLGCRLFLAEPLFNQELRDAIQTVEEAIDAYATDTVNQPRATLTLAMLYALNGQLQVAQALAEQVLAEPTTSAWANEQAQALVDAIQRPGATALDICESLARLPEAPACRIDDLLDRYLGLVTLNTDEDLIEQLAFYGFPVSESLTVSEIGRAQRTLVNIALSGAGWWTFRADRSGVYIPERAEAPTGFEEAFLPQAFIQPPQRAIDALLIERNPSAVLSILATVEQNSGGVPLAYSARYMRALSYELVGDRQQSRRLYYELWQTVPESIWGRLASKHLELRQ